MACAADGLKFSFYFILITQISVVTWGLWLLYQTVLVWAIFLSSVRSGSGLLSKKFSETGAFAALPKQGSTENLEDKLPAFSLGSETTCSSNILSWSFQHSPTSRSPDSLLSYIVRTVKSEQTNPGTTALDSGRVSTSRELFKMQVPGPRLYWV